MIVENEGVVINGVLYAKEEDWPLYDQTSTSTTTAVPTSTETLTGVYTATETPSDKGSAACPTLSASSALYPLLLLIQLFYLA